MRTKYFKNICLGFCLFSLAIPIYAQTLNESQILSQPTRDVIRTFGETMASDGNVAVVGAYGSIDPALDPRIASRLVFGRVYVYIRTNGVWVESAILEPEDRDSFRDFGRAVAIQGNTIVVGAPGVGRVLIYTGSGSNWTQQTVLSPEDDVPSNSFGRSVSIDGNTVLIGAGTPDRIGAAYVFTGSASTWTQQARLEPNNGEQDDNFGAVVALGENTAMVGATGAFTNANTVFNFDSPGSVYVFTRSGANWIQQAELMAEDAEADQLFGDSISLDGNRVAIGASKDDQRAENAGAAYIFERNLGLWTQQAKLIVPGDRTRLFGRAISLEGTTLIVASDLEAPGPAGCCGAGYTFELNSGQWTQRAFLTPANDADRIDFGRNVLLNGNTAFVRRLGNSTDARRGVFIFDLDQSPVIPVTPINVSPNVGASLTTGSTIEFIWQAQPGVPVYDFHLFNVTNGSLTFTNEINATTACSQTLCSIEQTITLPIASGHAWRVRAKNAGVISNWSRSTFNVVNAGEPTPTPTPEPTPGLFSVSFLSDSNGNYMVQNSSTRLIDCIAPAICDIAAGRYRLIGFDDFHSVYITVDNDGSVRFTYDGGLNFPFADVVNRPVTPEPAPAPEPEPEPEPEPAPAPEPEPEPEPEPAPEPAPEPGLVRVSFLSDSDGNYMAQNSSTRNIDCIAPAACNIEPGRYRLIGFDEFHSVYITVESDGSVRFTYDGGLDFPFAVAG